MRGGTCRADLSFSASRARVRIPGQPLGYDILGPTANIQSITKEDLLTYRQNNLHADKMVFAGAGAIDHDQLVELAQKHLSSFPTGPDPMKRSKTPKPEFIGSEVRVRDDSWDDCHIAIAVEGVPASSPDFWTMVSNDLIGIPSLILIISLSCL